MNIRVNETIRRAKKKLKDVISYKFSFAQRNTTHARVNYAKQQKIW